MFDFKSRQFVEFVILMLVRAVAMFAVMQMLIALFSVTGQNVTGKWEFTIWVAGVTCGIAAVEKYRGAIIRHLVPLVR